MNISGVLVHAFPDKMGEVCKKLNAMPGIEVHGHNEKGRIVVTVEKMNAYDMADAVIALQNTKNILSAAVIYHHDEDVDEEIDISHYPIEAPSCACEELNNQEALQ